MATEPERLLRVGVVGAGNVGEVHARAYLGNPAVEFVGLSDVIAQRADEKARRLRVPGFHSVAELLDKGRPDLVSVVVQLDHFEQPIRECLAAGVHVLSEKPISFDAGRILALVREAEARGVQFGVGFNQRFTQASQWFKALADESRFGQLLWTWCQYNQDQVWHGFSLREHMIHQFDLWRYHMGEFATVTAQACGFEGDPAKRDVGVVGGTVQFASGAIGVFTNGAPPGGGPCNSYELVGTLGRGYCENFVGRATFRTQAEPTFQVLDPPWVERGGYYWDSVAAHLQRVVQALCSGAPLPVPARAAFEAQVICDAVIRAVKTGQRIDVQARRAELLAATVSTPGGAR